MRAFIKRSHKCLEFLNTIEINKDAYFDQEYYLFKSEESFHGEIRDNCFTFMDARLPVFTISIEFMEIEE